MSMGGPFNITRTSPILFGSGASRATGERVKGLGCRKVICITDKGVKSTGIADTIVENLKGQGIEVILFDGVTADPPDDMVERCAAMARDAAVDGVVGVGGGSSLDTAKAVNILLGNPSPVTRYFNRNTPPNPGKVLVLIPTTAGTGSEVTAVSVLTDTASNKKMGVIGPACLAALAVVDPDLTLGLPPSVTAATGMDAFAHAAEALTSTLANPMSDILGEKAVALIVRYLPQAVKDGGDLTARTNMSLAACIAGVAFNDAIPHLGHAIGHTLGAFFHIPHGAACAVALPEVMEHVAAAVPDKVRIVAAAMGLDAAGLAVPELGRAVAGALRALARSVGIKPLGELNVDRSSLKEVAREVLHDGCAFFTPRKTTPDDVLAMLEGAYD